VRALLSSERKTSEQVISLTVITNIRESVAQISLPSKQIKEKKAQACMLLQENK
jgi:hypothetical protein